MAKFTNSPLVSFTQISPNKTSPRTNKILKITPHHMAGNLSLKTIGNLFSNPNRDVSCNYAIDSKGNVGMLCEEKDRSWCSASPSNDHQAITIEVANDGGAPEWHVSDAALNTLVKLCVDICQRNEIKELIFTGDAKGNLTQHNYFSATACPGPYLKSKFKWLADEVNKQLSIAVIPTPPPVKNELKVGDMVRIIGLGNGSSKGNANIAYGYNWIRYITKIYKDNPYPYQVGNKGKVDSKNTTGFYKADGLKKL